MCSGVHKFSKYLWATTKDQVPEEWHETSSMLRIQNSGVSVHIVVRIKKKVFVRKILIDTKKNLVNHMPGICAPLVQWNTM